MAQPLLPRMQVRAIDQALIVNGMPGVLLMENAGRGAAEILARGITGRGLRRAVVLVGPGNNGGDGLVVARHLRMMSPGLALAVVAPGDLARMKGDAAVMRDAWRAVNGAVETCGSDPGDAARLTAGCDLVVDALFGTGLDRELAGPALALVEAVNGAGVRWAVALDVPSGLDADTGAPFGDEAKVFRAHETLTFAVSKPGLHTGAGRRLAGEVTVVGLGAPVPAEQLATRTWLHHRRAAGPRAIDAHKGTAGHVLVVGGSAGKTGAALLCARGAHRAGAGLVTLASRAATSLDARVTETMCLALPDDASRASEVLAEALGRMDAVVVGPGLGHDAWARAVFESVLAHARGPVVIDADGLGFLAPGAGPPLGRVLTPHPLEMARLMGVEGGARAVNADRLGHARAAARRFGAVTVLKGAGTVVATPEGGAHITTYAEPTLAVAGSGDVLGGVIAARLAERGTKTMEFAVLEAVAAHGRAGERVRAARGATRGALASEIADAVSRALEEPDPPEPDPLEPDLPEA